MSLFRACNLCFSMYSKLPTFRTRWDPQDMRYVLCFFPLVGLVEGAFLLLALTLCRSFGLSGLLQGALLAVLPLVYTGGIHMDGLCDVADALGSHQSRERMLEILKDSRCGAAALMTCGGYLALHLGLGGQLIPSSTAGLCLLLLPALSRCLSGLCAAWLPNARGDGLLFTFTSAQHTRRVRLILAVLTGLCAAGLLSIAPLAGAWMLGAAGAVLLYYITMSRRKFGGVTGDLAGFFLQLCELGMLAGLVCAQLMGGAL